MMVTRQSLLLPGSSRDKAGIEGEDHPKVIECIDLLRDISLGKMPATGDRVAVIGGGNAAIDAARTVSASG